MSNLAANPAAVPDLLLRMMTQANQSLCPRNDGGGLRSSIGSLTDRMARANRAARTVNFFDQGADENFASACVCRFVSRLCLGHGFGAGHAPHHPAARRPRKRGPRFCGTRSSASTSSPLRVTVPPETSLQTRPRTPRKLLPGPSQKADLRHLGAWPLARLRPV